MKQVIQSYKTGKINLFDVPVPPCKSGGVLVRNVNSLISIGTEKSMIEVAKKSLLGKAIARPDLVKRFVDKAKREGLVNVYKEAMNRLDEPVSLGYSSAGIVIEVGAGVTEFKVGDRVACAGAGFAGHAEVIWVPKNLCVKIPDNLGFDEASFVMLGGIALQGIRLAELTFGENVVVIGLGLLGLLTVQILNAYSCDVIGIDIDEGKVELAKEFDLRLRLIPGRDDIIGAVSNFTKSYGVDAVIITASSKDNTPIRMAQDLIRKKGTIILVGVADLNLDRKTLWEKEINFVVSKAAGAGSLETTYEQKGYDYPIQYVRWTEKRNLEHFIELLSKRKLKLNRLITHRFKIDDALGAYDMLTQAKQKCIGVLLEYENGKPEEQTKILASKIILRAQPQQNISSKNIGLIGAGMFTKNILLPALSKVNQIKLIGIATTTGMTSNHIARRYGFEYCTSDYRDILKDPHINYVIITTPHNLHANMVIEALEAGKHTFVEKPLCINTEELKRIVEVYNATGHGGLKLMVGFNRRFSSLASQARAFFENRTAPLIMNYRVNAGFISPDHWTQDTQIGAGKIIGEVCHFIDFFQFITSSYVKSIFAEGISREAGKYLPEDNVCLNLKFMDGSVGSITYCANGSKAFSRERIEVFGEESVLVIDDFRTLILVKAIKQQRIKKLSCDMGYLKELNYFLNSPVFDSHNLFEGYIHTTLATIKTLESMRKGVPCKIDPDEVLRIIL